ncbi:MAG TPA: hypothetical protein VLU54_15435 [Casimicrobiaceae bacterium]|nr:hypothetical protein [Casimicrobiaceae bacterium]
MRKLGLFVVAAIVEVTLGQAAYAQKAYARTQPPAGNSQLALRIFQECAGNPPISECVAYYVVPAGYDAVLESVSMYAGGLGILDAEVRIIGSSPASFRLPLSSNNGFQSTVSTAYAGRITVLAGEEIRLRVFGYLTLANTSTNDFTVAASGYLVPSGGSGLAP